MKKSMKITPPTVGASSLLVIFAVLCLTVFSLLSISTVQADGRLGDKTQAAVYGYYGADCEAEAILARLRAGEIPAGVAKKDGVFSYACQISPTQMLIVEVTVAGADYTVHRWQAVSTTQWQADERIPVWTGGSS